MTAKQISLAIVLFLLTFLFGLVVNMPAIQLFQVIKMPEQVKIQGLQGTITSGQIDRMLIQGYSLSRVEYRIQSSCFFKLALCYQLLSEDDGLDINLQYSLLLQGIRITDSLIDLPASFFKMIPNLPVRPAGLFKINIENLQLDTAFKLEDIKAQVEWVNAGVQGEDQVIGNYMATIKPSRDGIDVALSDRDSLLGLKGSVSLNWQGEYDSDLEFQKRNGLNPSIVSILDISAKKSGLNQYRLKNKGRLPVNISSTWMKYAPNSQK